MTVDSTKDSMLQLLDQQYSGLDDKVQAKKALYNSDIKYKSLICLGVSGVNAFENGFADQKNDLREALLNDYVELKKEVLEIETKSSLGLIDSGTYNQQQVALTSDIANFQQKYTDKIQTLLSDSETTMANTDLAIAQYTVHNQDLLNQVGGKLTAVLAVEKAFGDLETTIREMNQNRFGVSRDTMKLKVDTLISGMDINLNEIMQAKKTSTIALYGDSSGLEARYDALIAGYHTALTQMEQDMFGGQYDEVLFSHIEDQMAALRAQYRTGSDGIDCQALLTGTGDVIADASTITHEIAGFAVTPLSGEAASGVDVANTRLLNFQSRHNTQTALRANLLADYARARRSMDGVTTYGMPSLRTQLTAVVGILQQRSDTPDAFNQKMLDLYTKLTALIDGDTLSGKVKYVIDTLKGVVADYL